MARNRVDWQAIRLEYISDRGGTYRSLAAKYDVPERTLRWHAMKESWRDERVLHRHKIADNLAVSTANSVLLTVQQLNEHWLQLSNQMRALLEHKLYVRTQDTGEAVPRDSLSVQQIGHAIAAFGELYKFDRLALGADLAHSAGLCSRCERLEKMSDRELLEQLEKSRARFPDERLEAELRKVREATPSMPLQ